jgi:hypothetical protein
MDLYRPSLYGDKSGVIPPVVQQSSCMWYNNYQACVMNVITQAWLFCPDLSLLVRCFKLQLS